MIDLKSTEVPGNLPTAIRMWRNKEDFHENLQQLHLSLDSKINTLQKSIDE